MGLISAFWWDLGGLVCRYLEWWVRQARGGLCRVILCVWDMGLNEISHTKYPTILLKICASPQGGSSWDGSIWLFLQRERRYPLGPIKTEADQSACKALSIYIIRLVIFTL